MQFGSVDIDRALNDVKDQIAKIRTDLPRTIDEPIISRIDIEGLPIVTTPPRRRGFRSSNCRGHLRSHATCRASMASARSSASAGSIGRSASPLIRRGCLLSASPRPPSTSRCGPTMSISAAAGASSPARNRRFERWRARESSKT